MSGKVAAPFHAARNDDLLRDLLVERCDVVLARAVVKRADDGGIAAGENAQDAAFGALVFYPSARKTGARRGPRGVSSAVELHQHLVAVHG